MDKNSYPSLSESEIHNRLSSLFPSRITAEQSLRNPDYVRQAYELVIEMLSMVDVSQQYSLPSILVNRHCRFPEMHGHSPIRFLMLMKKCLQNARVEEVFTLNDLKNPTVKRSQRFLSGLINFCLHVMSTRNTEAQLLQERLTFQKDLMALKEHRDNLKNQLSELECQRMSDELEVAHLKRRVDEKFAAARTLAVDVEQQKVAVEKLSFELDEEVTLKEEAEQDMKHTLSRLALLREEIVDTPVDQLKAEVKDYEEQLQRQEEIVRLKQDRFSELQKQINNLEKSHKAVQEFQAILSRFGVIEKDVQNTMREHQAIKASRLKKEEDLRAVQAAGSAERKKLTELNDKLIKLNLIDKENEKHQEALRRNKESDITLLTADANTLEAEVQTLKEHAADIREQRKLEQSAVQKRQAKLDEAIAMAVDYIEDFRERGLGTISRLQ